MLKGIIDDIKRERAKFIRNVAYLREMSDDDMISDRLEKAESLVIKETAEDIKEAVDMVNYMPSNFDEEDNAEIERLMTATESITFDEMIGIK